MLHYPKIPGSKNCPEGKCIAFEKYDGTNLHWSWDAKTEANDGWIAFGTRRDEYNLDADGIGHFEAAHPEMTGVAKVFEVTSATPLARQIRKTYPTARRVICFTEYFGQGSFAGLHRAEDPKRLVLFDVEIDGTMIGPEEFVSNFGIEEAALLCARVVYKGKLTGKFAEDVRNGKYKVAEGVVCKGAKGAWMAKIKTYEYMERLKRFDPKNWEQYWE